MQPPSNIRNRIFKILTSTDAMSLQLDTSQIGDATSLSDDLALDSIQKLELSIGLEEVFGIALDVNLFETALDKFGDLEEYIRTHGKP